MKNFVHKFWYVTRGKHKNLILMMFLFLMSSFLEMFGTGLIGPFAAVVTNPEIVESNRALDSIYRLGSFDSTKSFTIALSVLILIAFTLKAAMTFIAQKSIAKFTYNLKGDLSLRLMKAYLAAPYTYHLNRNSAGLVQSIVTSTDQFCIGLVLSLLTAISNSVVVIALVALLVYTNAFASIGISFLLLCSFIILNPLKARLSRWGKSGHDASTEMIRILNHGMGGFKETKIIGCEPYFENQMHETSSFYARNMGLASGYSNLPRYVVEALVMTFLIFFAVIFVTLNQENEQSLSAIFGVFAIASIRLLPATGNTISCINVIRYNYHALDRLFLEFREIEEMRLSGYWLRDETTLVSTQASSDPTAKLSFSKNVVLKDLQYCYPNGVKNALDNVSLEIPKGQSIGLIGKSGSGKTTLVDVLMGLLLPQNGDIQVDGLTVYSNLRAWQNMIGYVPQSIFLIDDTLERNIAFGVPDHLIDHQLLDQAVRAAQLSEVIQQLPQGIKTTVGERGVLLSGGQRQRVGIARALYHEREILVFDEATAALDNDTESLVTEATKALSGSKTIIIIAHRLSTIEHCDKIYQLEHGKILKSGNYQAVVLDV